MIVTFLELNSEKTEWHYWTQCNVVLEKAGNIDSGTPTCDGPT